MRNPDRLDAFYNRLKDIHKTYVSDWRFGQMMCNFIIEYGDPFFLEEDEFIAAIENYIKKNSKESR